MVDFGSLNGADILDLLGYTPLNKAGEGSTNGEATGNLGTEQNLYFKSGTAFKGIFDHAITQQRTWTMPDFDGTVALLERAQTWTANQTFPDGSIAHSKLATLASGNILVGSAGGVATSIAMSGDATLSNGGVLTIANNAVTDAKIAAHTTTKITIANKALLPASIAYEDENNVFSVAQSFGNDIRLRQTNGIRFYNSTESTEIARLFNGNVADGSLSLYSYINSVRTAIDIGPTRGTLPVNDALAELVLYRTVDQTVNYARYNISQIAGGHIRFGQEFGGTESVKNVQFATENGVTAGREVFLYFDNQNRVGDSVPIVIEFAHLKFGQAGMGANAGDYYIARGGGTTLTYNLPTGGAHNLLVNNVNIASFSATGHNLQAIAVSNFKLGSQMDINSQNLVNATAIISRISSLSYIGFDAGGGANIDVRTRNGALNAALQRLQVGTDADVVDIDITNASLDLNSNTLKGASLAGTNFLASGGALRVVSTGGTRIIAHDPAGSGHIYFGGVDAGIDNLYLRTGGADRLIFSTSLTTSFLDLTINKATPVLTVQANSGNPKVSIVTAAGADNALLELITNGNQTYTFTANRAGNYFAVSSGAGDALRINGTSLAIDLLGRAVSNLVLGSTLNANGNIITNLGIDGISRNVDNDFMRLKGGTDNNGTVLILSGKSRAGSAGYFEVWTTDAAATASLKRMQVQGGTASNAGRIEFFERLVLGIFPSATANAGEAWVGRAADRVAGTMTVQLGNNGGSAPKFEIVDNAWTRVNFAVQNNGTTAINSASADAVFAIVNINAGGLSAYFHLGETARYAGKLGISGNSDITNASYYIKWDSSRRTMITVPNSAVADADLDASMAGFYLDEAGNALKVRVKYADGVTVKTGTVNLV